MRPSNHLLSDSPSSPSYLYLCLFFGSRHQVHFSLVTFLGSRHGNHEFYFYLRLPLLTPGDTESGHVPWSQVTLDSKIQYPLRDLLSPLFLSFLRLFGKGDRDRSPRGVLVDGTVRGVESGSGEVTAGRGRGRNGTEEVTVGERREGSPPRTDEGRSRET